MYYALVFVGMSILTSALGSSENGKRNSKACRFISYSLPLKAK